MIADVSAPVSWYAVKVAPRAEFRVQGAISRLERPSIMPFGERSVARENRPSLRRWRKYPLIPGYVFAGFFDMSDFANVRQVINQPLENTGQPRDVLGLVGFGNRPAVLKERDVDMLSTMSAKPELTDVPFSPGQDVIVYGRRTRVETVNYDKQEFDAFVDFLGSARLCKISFANARAA